MMSDPTFSGKHPDDFRKDIFQLVSALIAGAALVFGGTKLPSWLATAIIVILVFLIVIVLFRPINRYASKVIMWLGRKRFAKEMRPELLHIIDGLNEMLNRQRINTIPFVVADLSLKLSNIVKEIIFIDSYQQQFSILQSWTSSLAYGVNNYETGDFRRDSSEMAQVVLSFSRACTSVRDTIENAGYVDKAPYDIRSDWNAAVNRISNFVNRVEQFTKSVNAKYGTKICADSFQEVKPL